MAEGAGLENRWARKGLVSSNLTLSVVADVGRKLRDGLPSVQLASGNGWVAEWLKAHAWRACGLQKGLVGSNPTPSVGGGALINPRRRLTFAAHYAA